jgi:hypothetical protein
MERLDMSARDREIFEYLALFAYNEGKICGKEEYLDEHSSTYTSKEIKTSDNAESENIN